MVARDGQSWDDSADGDAYDADTEEDAVTQSRILYSSPVFDYGLHNIIVRSWGNDSRVENGSPLFGVDHVQWNGETQGATL